MYIPYIKHIGNFQQKLYAGSQSPGPLRKVAYLLNSFQREKYFTKNISFYLEISCLAKF